MTSSGANRDRRRMIIRTSTSPSGGLPGNRELAGVTIRGNGSGEWKSSNKDRFTVLVVRAPARPRPTFISNPTSARLADCSISSSSSTTARRRSSRSRVEGRPQPPAPRAGIEVKWLGLDGQDRTGAGPSVGPNGFEDAHLTLSKLSAKAEIKSVEVTGSGGLAWHSGLNLKALASAELIRNPNDKTRADLYFSPGRDLGGQTLKVAVDLRRRPRGRRVGRRLEVQPGQGDAQGGRSDPGE